jgi:hypothetical protein
MRRREWLCLAGAAAPAFAGAPLVVPVYLVVDSRAKFSPGVWERFSLTVWPEAVRDFQRCGIQLQSRQGSGEVRRAPSGRPVFNGLAHGTINMVLTDVIPLAWDKARGLAGVTTQYDGHHLCLISLPRAHGHQVPFLSLNTCVHELLHVLMQDIYETKPKGLPGDGREFRIDWYATKLWLFHDGADIRRSAAIYLERRRARSA